MSAAAAATSAAAAAATATTATAAATPEQHAPFTRTIHKNETKRRKKTDIEIQYFDSCHKQNEGSATIQGNQIAGQHVLQALVGRFNVH